jgi:hypothetical protein
MVISQDYHTPYPKHPQKQKEPIAQTPHPSEKLRMSK